VLGCVAVGRGTSKVALQALCILKALRRSATDLHVGSESAPRLGRVSRVVPRSPVWPEEAALDKLGLVIPDTARYYSLDKRLQTTS
jgi:hypothetical protein